MKNKSIMIAALLVAAVGANAQDMILKKDGSEIKAKVLEITDQQIKYKDFDFQSGTTQEINISEVFMIRGENRKERVFNKSIETKDPFSQEDPCNLSSCGLLVACNDYPNILTYSEAVNYCPAGYQLPSIEELECMAKDIATLRLSIIGEYWSVTTTGNNVYTVTMDDGKREQCEKSEKKRVRYIKDPNYIPSENAGLQVPKNLQSTDNQFNKNYALLHFYRPGMFYGCGAWFYVYLDGKEVWQCKNGRRKTIKITEEGTITVHTKEETESSLTFDVEFGKEYYIEGAMGAGMWSGFPIISYKDESVGHSMFNTIKAKNDDTDKLSE